MIKETEFRLGNYLQDSKTKSLLKITGLGEATGIEFLVIDRSKFPLPDGWQFEPIPLTPAVLEAVGLKYHVIDGVSTLDEDTEPDESEKTYEWEASVKSNDHCESFNFSIVKWGSEGDFTFSNHWLRVRVKYLHQLQNLFFALTGSELTYNPEIKSVN